MAAVAVRLLLQPVAQHHQRINLCDDAALFGEGWKGKGQSAGQSNRSPRANTLGARPCMGAENPARGYRLA